MFVFEIGVPLRELQVILRDIGLIHGKLSDVLQVLRSILDVVARSVLELKYAPAPELVELALDCAVRAKCGRVCVEVAKPDSGNGTTVGTVHETVGTIGTMAVRFPVCPAAQTHLTSELSVFALLLHVLGKMASRNRLFALKRTGNGNVQTLSLCLANTEVQLQILVLAVPRAALALHGTVDAQNSDPVAQLAVKESGKPTLFADGAGLGHDLDACDARLAVVLTAAGGEVWVVHDREADGAAAVIGRLLDKPYVKPSPG